MAKQLAEWQEQGWIPDMRIEPVATRYQGPDLLRARGWTHWHHLFNARQLLVNVLLNSRIRCDTATAVCSTCCSINARLSIGTTLAADGGIVKGVFYNQALNTLYNYGCRGYRVC